MRQGALCLSTDSRPFLVVCSLTHLTVKPSTAGGALELLQSQTQGPLIVLFESPSLRDQALAALTPPPAPPSHPAAVQTDPSAPSEVRIRLVTAPASPPAPPRVDTAEACTWTGECCQEATVLTRLGLSGGRIGALVEVYAQDPYFLDLVKEVRFAIDSQLALTIIT